MNQKTDNRIDHKRRRILGAVVSLLLVISLSVPAWALPPDLSGARGADLIRLPEQFTVRSAVDIRQQEGLSWKQWNEMTLGQQTEGSVHPISVSDVLVADPTAKWKEEDGQVYMLSGHLPVRAEGALDACRAVYQLLPSINAREDVQLFFFKELRFSGYVVYMFQEVFEGYIVPGSTVRLITKEDGAVCAVLSSLTGNAPVSAGALLVDAQGAEESVRKHLASAEEKGNLLTEYTEQIIMPQPEEEEDEDRTGGDDAGTGEDWFPEDWYAEDWYDEDWYTEDWFAESDTRNARAPEPDLHLPEDTMPDMLVWAVYTEENGAYKAHYVSADGIWKYSIDVKMPGDDAARCGFEDIYLFDRLAPDFWTGTVTTWDGSEKTVTVPVMQDPETGTYYLGDAERKILFADYAEYGLNEDHLVPVTTPDNTGWRDDDLLTYVNYLQVWDLYDAMGWRGPDGVGTPSLLLRDLCFDDGIPMENAAYIAEYGGWQVFAYDNSSIPLGEAFDVIAHEFTHAVSFSAQGMNLYWDDSGAINESLSDIMAVLFEAEVEGEADWLLGEDTGMILRSMLDPHAYNQPEYVWDLFYTPHAQTPKEINDRGGVHSNSSLLNILAGKMLTETGMTLQEAQRFWMTVICTMTPEADLVQMSDLLMWALHASGNTAYEQALQEQIERRRLTQTQIPDPLPQGQKVVTLTLPDTETMNDPCWILQAIQLDTSRIPDMLLSMAGSFLSRLESALSDDYEEEEESGKTPDIIEGFGSIHSSWVADETNQMTMIIQDQPALYLLMNLDDETMEMRGMAVLAGDQWIDLMTVIPDMNLDPDSDMEQATEEIITRLLESGLDLVAQLLQSILSSESYADRESAEVTQLSGKGLEQIQLVSMDAQEEW